MTPLTALGVFNYALVLIYGLFLSTFISGGWQNNLQKRLIFLLCPLFLAIQSPCWLIFGEAAVKQLYPLIVHLPLVLILVFALKRRFSVALVSVCTAYLCCQLPRWVNLTVSALTGSALAGEISYAVAIGPLFWLICRFFVRPAHAAMSASPQSLLLFGSLPVAYYIFDYATVVYSNALYSGIRALNEFIPTMLIVFYVLFLSAYHVQMQKRSDSELQRSMLEAELKQSEVEMDGLRSAATQVAVYQHDMRHHLNAIEGFLSAGEHDRAADYIRRVRSDVEAVTPRRYCENELVNLLCSSFAEKSCKAGVALTVDAAVPRALSLPDTELCSVLSNALENALHAAEQVEPARRKVSLYCTVQRGKLLLEVCNPCAAPVRLENGLPAAREGHGYGCRSILAIAGRHNGLCQFLPADNTFTLRFMVPLDGGKDVQQEAAKATG